jgi:hypothetical protein
LFSVSPTFLSSTTEHQPTLLRYHVPHNVSHHIDYITPGIKLMTGGQGEKITKRMIGRRSLPVTGDVHGEGRKGGEESWKGTGKGKKKCKPRPDPSLPVHPGPIESQFLVTGPCSDEITPHCIRGKFILYRAQTVPAVTLIEAQPSIRSPMAPRPRRGTNLASFRVWANTTAKRTSTATGNTLPRKFSSPCFPSCEGD